MLFLPVSNLESLAQLIELEVFIVNDGWRVGLTYNEIPAFFFEEGIGGSTAEVADFVGFDGDDDLEEISSSDI